MGNVFTSNSRSYATKSRLFGFLVLAFIVAISSGVGVWAMANGVVKGKVVDKDTKELLRGATVTIPALRVGAISDKKGEFTFSAPVGNHSVEARYIGYETSSQKINVKAGETVTIVFEIAAQSIQTNEIVIVGLTGEVDRNKLGNTISSINGKEIAKVVSPSAIDALSGRVTGVTVTRNSGTPGAGTFITMRGRKSIMGSSEPLYVIDGIIMDNSSLYDGSGKYQFSNRAVDVNPQDIESMEILKGASAAAIYGSQAANGVVLITTKKGKLTQYDKPAQIIYNSSLTYDIKAGNIPLQTEYGQTTPYQTGKPGSSTSWGAKLPAGTTTYKQDEAPFRTGVGHEQSVSVIGGVPQFDYLLNGTYGNTQGYVEGSELVRTSVRGNIGASIFPGVTIQSNNNFISIDNSLPQDGSNTAGILLGALRTPPNFDNSKYLEADGSQRRFAGYDNPIWTQKFNTYASKTERFLHSTELNIKPYNWLTFATRIGVDRYQQSNVERIAVGSRANTSISQQGYISHSNITNNQMNLDFSGTLTQRFFEDQVEMNLVGGAQTIWTKRTADASDGSLTLKFFDQLNSAATRDASSSSTQKKIVGLFGQLTTSLWDRYTLTLAIRRDGSSTFGTADQFHYYPKVGFSYVISKEPFMEGVKEIIDNLKLRATYGEAGSPSLPYEYATNFLYGTSGFFDPWERNTSTAGRGGFVGIRQGGGSSDAYIVAGAKDLSPEKSIEREIGFDVSLFQSLVSIEASFYHTSVFDMILDVPVPASTGFDRRLLNGAEMWNEGIEVGIKANPFRGETFAWTTSLNYSKNYNEVTKLAVVPAEFAKGNEFIQLGGGFTGINNIAMKGQPLGMFFGYGWHKYEDGSIVYTGDKVEVDANGEIVKKNGRIVKATADDIKNGTFMNMPDELGNNIIGAPAQNSEMTIIGNPNPKFQLSWRNDITLFGDFTISFLWDGVFGQDVWNGTRGALYNFGTAGDTKDRDALWVNDRGEKVIDNSDPNAPVQVTRAIYYQQYANGFYTNEAHVEKASYIKLRELTFEYRWKGLSDWNIGSITFSFSARNLLTISDYDGYDPEVNTFSAAEGRGFDYFTLPQVRSYRFGLSINY